MSTTLEDIKKKNESDNSCWSCDKKNTNQMVQCDICERWNHFECAGVTEEQAENEPFKCEICNTDNLAQEVTGAGKNLSENEYREALLKAQQEAREERNKREEIEQKAADDKDRHFKQMEELQKFFAKKFNDDGKAANDKLEENVKKLEAEFREIQRELSEKAKQQEKAFQEKIAQLRRSQEESLPSIQSSAPTTSDNIFKGEVLNGLKLNESLRPSMSSENSGENSAIMQLAMTLSRQHIQRLPEFKGDAKEWAYFESVYESTTTEGNFSETQNVKRLGKALKSPALDLVRDKIMFSCDATSIMNDLRDAYGRPERVIVKLIDELMLTTPLERQPEHKLEEFAVKVKNLVATVKSLKRPNDLVGSYTVAKFAEKLNEICYREWMLIRIKKPDVGLEDFSEFLMERVKLIGPISRKKIETQVENRFQPNRNSTRINVHQEERSSECCLICDKRHATARCYKLLNATSRERSEMVNKARICVCCLNSNHHGWRDCPKKQSCEISGCGLTHHRLMHRDKTQSFNIPTTQSMKENIKSESWRQKDEMKEEKSSRPSPSEKAKSSDAFVHMAHMNGEHELMQHFPTTSNVLFKVVPVTLYGNDNTSVRTFAFLDGGSQSTLMEKSLFDKLRLDGTPKQLRLQWTKGIIRTEQSYETRVLIRGMKNRKIHRVENVCTVENLSLPSQTVNVSELKNRFSHLRDLPLNDLHNAKPQLLIGLRHPRLIACIKSRFGKHDDEPVASRTELGWVVYGVTAPSFNFVIVDLPLEPSYQFHITEPGNLDEELVKIAKMFFEVEDFGVNAQSTWLSGEERRAEKIISETMRQVDNRMEIGLLWKSDDVQLADSYRMAMNRLKSQEKSLVKRPELLQWTNNHVKEMIAKGHAREATKKDLSTRWPRVAYIPTFIVVNPNKDPPKPRFVMDFAAKSGVNGQSVNSELLVGPSNLAPMLGGLCKLREHKVAVNADVKEMFHQVLIKEEDQQVQRFLWRNGDTSEEPTIYILQVMAFGPTCSPSSAQAVKNFNAERFRKEYPEAVESIVKHTYVDDYQNSHDNIDDALRVSLDAIKIFNEISFPLVGFQSNKDELLDQLPPECVKTVQPTCDLDNSKGFTTKILGAQWDKKNDVITYKLNVTQMIPELFNPEYRPTKKEVMSTIMKVFDPLGLISHFMIRARIIFQEVWRDGTEWSEKIDERLQSQWNEWILQLQNIERLKIPRQYAPINPLEATVNLIIFSDASDKGYAATGYFQFQHNNEVYVAHVMSKAKVAPLKQLSIPKLELQAALLAARVGYTIKKLHSFNIHATYYATDSKVVLSWITSDKLKLRQFVIPRVSEILDLTARKEWNYVRSKLNVADDGTKPNDPFTGDSKGRWFQGPDYLKMKPELWPFESALHLPPVEQPELILMHQQDEGDYSVIDQLGSRFKAAWTSLVRVIARMLAFTTKRNINEFKALTVEQLTAAESVLFRKIQFDVFPEERLQFLQDDTSLDGSIKSKLHSFTPFMSNGLIRMSSRAQKALTSYAAKNPVILPNKHWIVDLMIQHFHEKNFHLGEEATIANIREQAWIINIRTAFRRVKSKCLICKLRVAKPKMPLMGQLPEARMSFHMKPFTHVGVDCFGPYEVKFNRGRVKRWGIIFTCLTFRAVHLELINDMSKEECLSAIRRLQTRRGKSVHFYSDRGTNFIGASNEIKRNVRDMMKEFCENVAQLYGITWHFQPAYSPWFGGAFERLIQSIKKCIEYVFNGETPREDIFRNALCEAEYLMNSRPLTHLSIDHEDEKPLTPNTALFGGDSEYALAPGVFTEADAHSKSSYRRSQQLADKMVSRWIKEYLPTIIKRKKWLRDVPNIKIGDIAILVDPTEPRDAWKLGKITLVYPGDDGRVRAADILLSNGVLKSNRSAGCLAVLDIMESSSDPSVKDGVEDVPEGDRSTFNKITTPNDSSDFNV